jgi:hypothetical protein
MTIQTTFLDPQITPPAQLTAEDLQRITGHNGVILRMLKTGPKTNATLASISLNHTARISNLRARGYVIECAKIGGGLTIYTLIGKKERT